MLKLTNSNETFWVISNNVRESETPNFFQAKNAYSFDDYIVLHVTLAGIATALQAAAVPRFFAVGKTLTYLMEFYLTKFHESQQCR